MKLSDSFPVMSLADAYGLPYGVTLLFVDSRRLPRHQLNPHHHRAIDAIIRQIGFRQLVRLKTDVADARRYGLVQ